MKYVTTSNSRHWPEGQEGIPYMLRAETGKIQYNANILGICSMAMFL